MPIANAIAAPGSLGQLIPALTVLVAVILDVTPLPHPGPTAVAPLLTLGGVYFWLIHRPRLMRPPLIFALTILLDAWSDLPLGLTALAFLAAYALLLPNDRFLASSGFLVVWSCFALAAGLTLTLRWLIASLWWGWVMPVGPAVFEWFLSVLFYPIISRLLMLVMRFLPRAKHASGR